MSDLIYIGNGAFVPGVPAKDLSAEQVKKLSVSEKDLLDSGLYKKASKPKTTKTADKDDK